MTRLLPVATARRALPPAPAASPAFTALCGDRIRLRSALQDKRATIARLEAAWVAAAEADATAGRARAVHMDNRASWDHVTWDRYLAAASQREPEFMPRIRRLLGELANIEKLLALPSGQSRPPRTGTR